jgi:hypothetical protein
MAKKKARPAKKTAPKKKARSASKVRSAKKASPKKARAVKRASRKPAAPKRKKAPPRTARPPKPSKPASAAPGPAHYVRIDRVTQGPDGAETPANPLRINHADFLWIYVAAGLPASAAPHGEYYKVIGGNVDLSTRTPLNPPLLVGGQFRFSVIHYVLLPGSTYLFRFADNLVSPTYEDSWEIVTN